VLARGDLGKVSIPHPCTSPLTTNLQAVTSRTSSS
jgi:hypothetical protein